MDAVLGVNAMQGKTNVYLTNTEREICEYLKRGVVSSQQLSAAMGNAPKTIETHLTNIRQKYNVKSIKELLAIFHAEAEEHAQNAEVQHQRHLEFIEASSDEAFDHVQKALDDGRNHTKGAIHAPAFRQHWKGYGALACAGLAMFAFLGPVESDTPAKKEIPSVRIDGSNHVSLVIGDGKASNSIDAASMTIDEKNVDPVPETAPAAYWFSPDKGRIHTANCTYWKRHASTETAPEAWKERKWFETERECETWLTERGVEPCRCKLCKGQ